MDARAFGKIALASTPLMMGLRPADLWSPLLNLKWIEACRFAQRIEEALRNKEIIIDAPNRRLLSYNGEEDIYL